MAARTKPNGDSDPAVRIEYIASAKRISLLTVPVGRGDGDSGAAARAARRTVRIRVGEPRLDSFATEDLTPTVILRGVGLDVGQGVAASAVIEAGLPAAVVRDFAFASGITPSEIGAIVGVSDRTMSRKLATDERFGAAESDRAYRLFDVVARAVHAFGDAGKARRWMRRVVPSLGGRKPVDLLRTEIGTRDVLSALDRIEFGGVV